MQGGQEVTRVHTGGSLAVHDGVSDERHVRVALRSERSDQGQWVHVLQIAHYLHSGLRNVCVEWKIGPAATEAEIGESDVAMVKLHHVVQVRQVQWPIRCDL